MRKHYIDNLRTAAILLLFPFHTCAVYSGFEPFYVHVQDGRICTDFIALIYIFHQSILITAVYFVVKKVEIIAVQFILILSISFFASVLVCEIAKRIGFVRFMFGIKGNRKSKEYKRPPQIGKSINHSLVYYVGLLSNATIPSRPGPVCIPSTGLT